jgi:hypothetical protein
MILDWDVDTESGGTYDNGPYRVRIKSIAETQASTGNPQLEIKSEFCDGKYEGKTVTDWITLVETAGWKLVKFIKGMSVDIEKVKSDIKDTSSPAFRGFLNKMIGKTTIWVVGKKTREGVTNTTIVDYQPDPKTEETAKDEAWLV